MKKAICLTKLPQNRTEFSKNWKLLVNQLENDRLNSSNFVDKTSAVIAKKRPKKKRAKKNSENPSNPTKFQIFEEGSVTNGKASTSSISENEEEDDKFTNDCNKFDVDRKNVVSYAGAVKKCLQPSSRPIAEKAPKPLASRLTKCLAIDCEFVGVGDDGTDDMVARVSLVNLFGDCVYDKYVQPEEEIVDYRTRFSGIRPENLINASSLRTVQKEVSDMIKGRILVGHSVHKDLKVLFLSHPKKDLRDTSTYKACRIVAKTNRPSLKKLALLILGIVIQDGEHNSVTDARVAMQLYRTYRQKWEASRQRHSNKKRKLLKQNS